jgi:hypothetical protein
VPILRLLVIFYINILFLKYASILSSLYLFYSCHAITYTLSPIWSSLSLRLAKGFLKSLNSLIIVLSFQSFG